MKYFIVKFYSRARGEVMVRNVEADNVKQREKQYKTIIGFQTMTFWILQSRRISYGMDSKRFIRRFICL